MRLPGNRAAKTVRDEASGHPDTDGPGKHTRQEGAEDAGLAPLPSDLEVLGTAQSLASLPRGLPFPPSASRSGQAYCRPLWEAGERKTFYRFINPGQ